MSNNGRRVVFEAGDLVTDSPVSPHRPGIWRLVAPYVDVGSGVWDVEAYDGRARAYQFDHDPGYSKWLEANMTLVSYWRLLRRRKRHGQVGNQSR